MPGRCRVELGRATLPACCPGRADRLSPVAAREPGRPAIIEIGSRGNLHKNPLAAAALTIGGTGQVRCGQPGSHSLLAAVGAETISNIEKWRCSAATSPGG